MIELERVLAAVLVLGATFLATAVVWYAGEELLHRLAPGRVNVLSPALQLLIAGGGIGGAVWLLNVNVAVVLTVVAILSAGVSLALDRSAQDLIAGVKLAAASHVREGHHVVLCGHAGRVERMGLFTLTLVTASREGIVIPNSAVAGEVVRNKSLFRGQAVDVVATVQRAAGYERSVCGVVLQQVAEEVDAEYGERVFDPSVYLRELGALGDVWRVRVYISDEIGESYVRDVLARRVADALERSGYRLGMAHYVPAA